MSVLVGTTAGLSSTGEVEGSLIERAINHVTTDATGWWAVDTEGHVYHNGDQIATMPDDSQALCIEPTAETVWIGSDRARLFAIENGSVAEDEFFASAPGRDTWFTPWGAPADVRSMTLDADHTLYVNVHVGGILRYDDTGPVPTLDITADVHEVRAHPTQKGAIFAATAHGLAASHNGHDFEFRTTGLHAPYCRAVTVLDDRVIFSASTGPRTSDARLYSCPLWEDDISPIGGGLPESFMDNLDTHCLVSEGSKVYLGHKNLVWKSEDRGATWNLLADEFEEITSLAAFGRSQTRMPR